MKFLSVLVAVTGLILTSVQSAQAAPIFTSKDWSLEDRGSACVATTAVKLGPDVLKLELHLNRSSQHLLEFFVRTPLTMSQYGAVISPLDERRKIIYSFGPMQGDAQGNIFWMIPRATDSFVNYLRQQSVLPMRLLEAQAFKNFNFSLAGSTATIDKMIAVCHPAKNISSLNFEKAFLPATVTSIDPRKVQIAQTQVLRDSYHLGHQAFIGKGLREAELKNLKDQFAKQTKELSDVTNALAKLQTKDLPPLLTKKSDLEKKYSQLQASVQQKDQEIAQVTAQLPAAEAALKSAEAELAPIRPEYTRRKQLVDSAQSSLDRAQSRLSVVDQRINNLESQIRSLNNELTQVRSRIQSRQSELNRAESDLQTAENENNRFDERREIENELRNNFSYQNARRDKETYERELQRKYSERNRSARDRDQARSDLITCRGQQGADCSQKEADLNRAENELRRIESEISSLQWRIDSAESDIRRIESSVSDSVRRKKDQLLDRVESARTTVRTIQNDLSALNRRALDIGQIEIPNRQNEMAALRTERPALSQEIRSAEADLSQRQAELNQWKLQNDFDRKWTAFQKAQDGVDNLNGQIAALQKEKQKTLDNMSLTQSDLNKTNDQIAKLNLEVTRLTNRKAELDQALANFNKEQDRLNAEIQNFASALQEQKVTFEKGLPN